MREERDAPNQIMLGARNILYCTHLGLASYFDGWWSVPREQSKYLFNLKETPGRTKKFAYDQMRNEWDADTFTKVKPGLFGTHSNRKRAFTKMRRAGISKDWSEYRGRWKKRRVSDTYEDVLLPYPDAKACASLCQGGPVGYVYKSGTAVTDAWLNANVCINMCKNNALNR